MVALAFLEDVLGPAEALRKIAAGFHYVVKCDRLQGTAPYC